MNVDPAQRLYYQIQLDPFPQDLRVRNNRLKNYQYFFPGTQPCVLEINYLQEGDLRESCNGYEKIYQQGTVHILVDNRPRTLYSTALVMHEFFLYMKLAFPPIQISEYDVSSWVCDGSTAILPEYIADPVLCGRISNMIKGFANAESGADPFRELRLRACIFDCLALISEYAVNQAKLYCLQGNASISAYTCIACKYIHDHLIKRFSVAEVAQAAGISYHYLKNIFRHDTGMTIVEYTNRTRMQMVAKMITTEQMTLEEAGNAVGISDPAYLSRLFRKYTGMTVRQYRQVHLTKQQTVDTLMQQAAN